jgi:hypothetical protein
MEKKKTSWLSLLLVDDKSKVLESEYFTVDQASLIEKNGDQHNYEILFANKVAMANLAKCYKDYGMEIKEEALITAFNVLATAAAEEDKATYVSLREAFAIKEVEKKAEEKTEEKKDDAKTEEPKKEEPKVEDPPAE